jgi:tetratricopeptide (TPR) repeat protein
MLREDPTITNADEQAENLVNSTILEKIYNSDPDLEAGRIDPSLVLLEDAKLRGLEIENANILNNTCWFGSIYGYAEETLQFCDQAVALNPDDSGYRDSRGLARALTGDYAGAIEDFQFFVDSEEYDDTLIQQRKQWILDLKAGKNPFTAEVLEMLKGE